MATNTITIAVLGSGFTTVNGTPLGNVDRVVFTGVGGLGGFELDNVALNGAINDPSPVPEPATFGMAAIAGIAGLVAYRRRKRTA